MAAPEDHDEIVAAPDSAVIELGAIATPTTAINNTLKGADIDQFLVTFDQPYDAENPLDWPASRKWLVTDVLSATGFNRIIVSTIMAPALSTIAAELGMTQTESAMSMSIYLLATAFGPLVLGPLSEIYGRQVVLHASSVWFLVFNVLCGFAHNKETLIASRFLAGFGASAIYSLAGGVLGDIWRPEQRGRSMGAYLLIPLLGAAVGPIIGGFITGRTSWRWMFWATSIFQVAMMCVSFFSFDESYAPVILRRRVRRLRQETGNTRYYTAAERLDGDKSAVAKISRALTRPIRLLVFHPIIQISSILSGFNYGILYITLSTFSDLWMTQYHESVEISGLHYIACSLGEIVGSQIGGALMDHFHKRRSGGHNSTPESRIPLMFPAMFATWIGVLIYGWTAERQLYWLVVDIGVVIFMAGMQMAGMPIMAFVIDTYGEHTSSAMAARQFVMSLTAFLFPLFAPSMYGALGYGWTNTVIAMAGFVIGTPLALFVWKHGAKLRAKLSSSY